MSQQGLFSEYGQTNLSFHVFLPTNLLIDDQFEICEYDELNPKSHYVSQLTCIISQPLPVTSVTNGAILPGTDRGLGQGKHCIHLANIFGLLYLYQLPHTCPSGFIFGLIAVEFLWLNDFQGSH